MLEELKKLLKHATIYGLGTIIGKVIGFLLIPLYTHYLSPADYGVLELLDLTISVLGIFVGLGINASIFRFYYQYDSEGDKNEVISTALIFVCLVTSFVVAIAIWNAPFVSMLVFKRVAYSHYFQLMFISFLFSTIASVPEAYIMARQKSGVFTAVTVGTLTINLTLNVIVVAFLKKGVLGIVFVSALVRCLNTLFWMIYLLPRIKVKFSRIKLTEMLKYGAPLIPANGGLFVINFADRFFLSHLASLSMVGIYALGYKFGYMISILLIQPFNRIWQAQLFEIAKKDDADIVFGRIFTYFIFVLLFAAVGLSIFSKEIVQLVASPSFQAAYSVIPLIAGAFVLRGAYIYFQSGIFITKKTPLISVSVSAAVLLSLGLNYFLDRRFGYLGASITAMATNGFMAIMLFCLSHKVFRIRYEINRLAKLLVAASVLGWAGFNIKMDSITYRIGMKILLIISFPLYLWLLRFYNEAEQKSAREIWVRIRKKDYVPSCFKVKL